MLIRYCRHRSLQGVRRCKIGAVKATGRTLGCFRHRRGGGTSPGAPAEQKARLVVAVACERELLAASSTRGFPYRHRHHTRSAAPVPTAMCPSLNCVKR